jgi:hypothetical protein
MRHSSFVVLAAIIPLAATLPAAAQTDPQPQLVLSVFVGAATGHPLWGVPRQAIEQRKEADSGFAPFSPPLYDTLALSRRVGSGLMGGMAATLFPTARIGLQLDVTYLSLPLENGCTAVYVDSTSVPSDQEHKNQQLCDHINAREVSASALAVFGGLTFRATPHRGLSPYLRFGGGIAFHSRSTVAMEGQFVSSGATYSKGVVVDSKSGHTSASLLLGAGLTAKLGPGYQFRLEVRDIIAGQTRLVGSVNGLGIGPTDTRMYHHIGITMGLDVVLEQRRGRRY